jgi:DNA polymerase III delta prime subunit
VYEVITQIHNLGGLAVLAHIDTNKGAFAELTKVKENGKVHVPINCIDLFNTANYDAVEVRKGDYPDGYVGHPKIARFPAYYQASDNPDPDDYKRHSKEGLGSPFTWFKMEDINLEGLRQAFNDPDTRIHLMNDYQVNSYPKIISIKVGNGGFLSQQSFDLHSGLNSIIGGKGVGKSLVVEFLRFALQQPPSDENLHNDHVGKLEKRLVIGNTVEVVYELGDGGRYRIERQLLGINRDKRLQTHETCKNIDTGEEYKGDIPSMFPVLAYSQTEVIKIAENKNAQLQLIDRFIDPKPHEQNIKGIQNQLSQNDKDLAAAIKANSQLESVLVEISTLEEMIKALKKSLDDPIFTAFEKAEIKKGKLDARYQYLDELIQEIQSYSNSVYVKKPVDLQDNEEDDNELKQAHDIAKTAHQKLIKSLGEIVAELGRDKASISDVIMGWMPEFDQLEEKYLALLEQIGGDRKRKEQERRNLEEQKKELEKVAGELNQLVKNLSKLLDERKIWLDSLERAHRRYFDTRCAKYRELTALSEGKLQVDLEHAADRSKFEELLLDLLRGGGNTVSVSDRKRIAENIMPRRFVDLILDRNSLQLQDEVGLTPTPAQNTIEKLWSLEDFTQLLALQHSAYPVDVPAIRFKKEGDVYGELDELSVGQKCTALLIIALCDGKMPIVIDQPEDALDIASVWEDVAKKLRRGKDKRQFILTTHNSSVAVGGDSDQFFVLTAGAEYGMISDVGAIDALNVRQSVIDHLEGGEEPYKLRAKKYNL